MKPLYLLIVFFSYCAIANAQQYKVATYNLRFDNAADTGNLWKNRSGYVCNVIRYHQMDIMGTQEGLKHQLDTICYLLPYLTYYGKGRDDGRNKGEHSAIFFNKEKFRLKESGDFWLRENPLEPGKGWDATCCNRICSWIKLQDKKKSRKTFYVFNVHYDHQGVVARRESSKLVIQKIKEIAGSKPVILLGDFNGGRDTDPYRILEESTVLRDSHNDVAFPYENNTSFNGFGYAVKGNDIIDHIFITNQFKADSWAVLTDTYYGKYPSDHFPVLALLKWK